MSESEAIDIACKNLPEVSSSSMSVMYMAVGKSPDVIVTKSIYPSELSYFTVGFKIYFNDFGVFGWKLIEAF